MIKAIKACRSLGITKLWQYALYQIGLKSGHYRRITPSRRESHTISPSIGPFASFPNPTPSQKDLTLAYADEIGRGMVRLFGGEPVPLDLQAGSAPEHWTVVEETPPEEDIKFIWEPGRFGWAITLARAFAFSKDPAYARHFWDNSLQFLTAHPPNMGRQWQSAQEVAIRLMVMVFCDRAFAAAPSSTPANRERLWQAIAEHAQRIPPTLFYARAQNNNHLLTEAAGLYTAGTYLADHPLAENWRRLGWRWLNWGFQHQIDEFGTYVQHSVNYHRLMLQTALFADHIRRSADQPDWPEKTRSRLASGTRWLWALTDPQTGKTPNLGANDSAYILPLTAQPYSDFRPVLDAAAKAFLNQDVFDQIELAEMADWFSLTAPIAPKQPQPQASDMLRIDVNDRRAFIRTAQFTDRPSHADQLHVDLWRQGVNIAQDPGTYQYNAPPPWDNALAGTQVHNTLTLDGNDQMLRSGRFLWLDWAQAQILAHEIDDEGRMIRLTAEHDGYHKSGALHQRTLASDPHGWLVIDTVLPYGKPNNTIHTATLTWLLPDWDYEFEESNKIRLTGAEFLFSLTISGAEHLNLFRAGERLFGQIAPQPIWGWVSSIYGQRAPALMLVAALTSRLPLTLHSNWEFTE